MIQEGSRRSKRFIKVQEGSRRLKKGKEGPRSFKKVKEVIMVLECSRRFKKV